MERNNLIKKGVVVAVILLFIGLAFAPSINANIGGLSVDKNYIDISNLIEENDEDCDCISESDSNVESQYKFPMSCTLLFLLFLPILRQYLKTGYESTYKNFGIPIFLFSALLGCSWVSPPKPVNNDYTEEIYSYVGGECIQINKKGFFLIHRQVETDTIVRMTIKAHTLNPSEPVYNATPTEYFYAPILVGAIIGTAVDRVQFSGVAIGNIEWS